MQPNTRLFKSIQRSEYDPTIHAMHVVPLYKVRERCALIRT